MIMQIYIEILIKTISDCAINWVEGKLSGRSGENNGKSRKVTGKPTGGRSRRRAVSLPPG